MQTLSRTNWSVIQMFLQNSKQNYLAIEVHIYENASETVNVQYDQMKENSWSM